MCHLDLALVKKEDVGLPWWCSGWESSCQYRDMGSISGL